MGAREGRGYWGKIFRVFVNDCFGMGQVGDSSRRSGFNLETDLDELPRERGEHEKMGDPRFNVLRNLVYSMGRPTGA